MTDNVAAAKCAVQYLIDHGHRRIGMVNGHNYAVVSKERLEGYRRALEDNGIPYDPSLVVNGDYTEEYAYEMAESYVQEHPEMTAVFFASDLMAIGFMSGAASWGFPYRKSFRLSVLTTSCYPAIRPLSSRPFIRILKKWLFWLLNRSSAFWRKRRRGSTKKFRSIWLTGNPWRCYNQPGSAF